MRETKYSQKLYKAIRKLNLDREEKIQLLLCLYVNGCSSEDCAKLFGADEEKVVKFLESEKLYNYKACSKCGKLRDRENEFLVHNGNKYKVCEICEKDYMKNYMNEYNKKYYDDNREISIKNSREYRKNNKEQISKNKKDYYEKNKDKFLKYMNNYYEENKEERKKYSNDYYEENKEERKKYREKRKENIAEYMKGYIEDNRETLREYDKKYKNSEASIEQVQKLAIFEEVFGNQIRCKYCGRWMIPTVSQVYNRLKGIEENDKHYIYCSEECKEECPTFHKALYPKGFKPASSREVNPVLRQIVLERDDYTCQKCGKYENVRLHCHHVTPVADSPIEADDPITCITLCKECHKEVHKIPGCRYHELRCEDN